MGVGAGLYMCDVVKKSSRSLSHLLMSSCSYQVSRTDCIHWIVVIYIVLESVKINESSQKREKKRFGGTQQKMTATDEKMLARQYICQLNLNKLKGARPCCNQNGSPKTDVLAGWFAVWLPPSATNYSSTGRQKIPTGRHLCRPVTMLNEAMARPKMGSAMLTVSSFCPLVLLIYSLTDISWRHKRIPVM